MASECLVTNRLSLSLVHQEQATRETDERGRRGERRGRGEGPGRYIATRACSPAPTSGRSYRSAPVTPIYTDISYTIPIYRHSCLLSSPTPCQKLSFRTSVCVRACVCVKGERRRERERIGRKGGREGGIERERERERNTREGEREREERERERRERGREREAGRERKERRERSGR